MADKRIEEVIGDVLKGGSRERALEFAAYLREIGIPTDESESYWDVRLNGKNVCSIMITGGEGVPGPWTIWSDQEPGAWIAWSDGEAAADRAGEDEGDEGMAVAADGRGADNAAATDERTREVAWAHVNRCASCGGDCSPGKRKTVLGRRFDNLCSSALAFTDPDDEALDCAKKMVAARRDDILKTADTAK